MLSPKLTISTTPPISLSQMPVLTRRRLRLLKKRRLLCTCCLPNYIGNYKNTDFGICGRCTKLLLPEEYEGM